MKHLHGPVWLIPLLTLLSFGCEHDKTTRPTTPGYLPRTSPENVLRNLVTATERRDLQAYQDQLDPAYEFYFRPDDVGVHGMPAMLDLSEELCLARVMFTDPRVDTLWVNLGRMATVAVRDTAAPSRAVLQVDVPNADVGLLGPWPDSDAKVFYMNFGTTQMFLFSADTLGSGEVRFALLRHSELGLKDPHFSGCGRAAIAPASWGWLKFNMLLVARAPGGPCGQ
jgi:hypothetical protein